MFAVRDLQRHAAVVLGVLDLHLVALLAQLVGHILEGRTHHVGDEALHMGAARHHDHVAQAAFPGLAAARDSVSDW